MKEIRLQTHDPKKELKCNDEYDIVMQSMIMILLLFKSTMILDDLYHDIAPGSLSSRCTSRRGRPAAKSR